MNECLEIATKLQNIEMMKLLEAFGADVNAYNKSGESPLSIAIKHDMIDATEALLLLRANANKIESSGSELSAIHAMTIRGRLDLLKLARQICGAAADFEVPNERKRYTSLHLSAYVGHAEIMRFLLDVSSLSFDINIGTYRNDTSLTLAARRGYLEVVHLLISGGAAINRQIGGTSGPPALFCAAESGHYDVVKFLCEKGVNDLWRRFDGLSALGVAARKRRADIIEYLAEVWQSAGVANAAPYTWTVLREVVSHGHTDVVRVLLACNNFAGDSEPPQWPTLLCEAILFNEKESARLLIKHGVGINATYSLAEDDDGDLTLTPLHVAAGLGNLGLVRYLCEQGADVEGLSNENETVRSFAAARGRLYIVQYLVSEQNANVQSSSSYGFTPSEVAAAGGHRQVLEYLISHEALLPKRVILEQESCDHLTGEQDGTGEQVVSISDLAVDAEYWYRNFAFDSFLSGGYV